MSATAALGERIFHDATLSASGRRSCATCHDAGAAFAAPPGAGPVPLGGPALDVPGFRKAPSLRYAAPTPGFPDQYKANVNTTEVPYDRGPGDVPALNDSDIDDVIAFLNTLTDGFQP